MQFTKLFNSILDSTIWQEPAETKVVWITLLAMCDRYGDVFASIPGLASRAGVTITECEMAISCFLSPDQYSRTKDNDGRRVREIDGGWHLLNHGKYRELLSAEERREYNRRKQSEYREAKRKGVKKVSNFVNECQTLSALSTHTDTDTDTDTDTEAITPLSPRAPTTPIAQRVARLFGRRLSTAWAEAEVRVFKSANITEEELDLIEPYYSAQRAKGREGIHRRDLKTFLNNFRGEVDRAAAFRDTPEITAPQKRATCL